jgi:UDP-N-acetyl-D-mannosaminuronic acid transferase (WecB/TagA/CpsF family)
VERTGTRVIYGAGVSFFVPAGGIKRATVSWQRTGFEWLYRALRKPRRLDKHYLTTNLDFTAIVV